MNQFLKVYLDLSEPSRDLVLSLFFLRRRLKRLSAVLPLSDEVVASDLVTESRSRLEVASPIVDLLLAGCSIDPRPMDSSLAEDDVTLIARPLSL